MLAAKKALQDELTETPQSLTARIRGLNELTNNLNAYLKEYIMSEGFDRLKEELEKSKEELTTKVASLEAEMDEKEKSYSEKVRSLSEDYEVQTTSLNEKLETMKETFEAEKIKIEQVARDQMNQLKSDLDATLAEKGELQKEVFDKVEAHEKQNLLQKSIDQLTKTLDEVQAEKEEVGRSLKQEREEKERIKEL